MDHLAPSLAVLSAMITPAVLISACGTLILSTSQRLGRVVCPPALGRYPHVYIRPLWRFRYGDQAATSIP